MGRGERRGCPRCGTGLRVSPKGEEYCPVLSCRWPRPQPVGAVKAKRPSLAMVIFLPIGIAGVLWVVSGFIWAIFLRDLIDPLPQGVTYRVEDLTLNRKLVTLRVPDPRLSERQCRRLIENYWTLTKGAGQIAVEKPLPDGTYFPYCVNSFDLGKFKSSETTFNSEAFHPALN